MGLKKSKKLRTIFIEYVVSLGVFIIFLIVVNYYLLVINPLAYPANYTEKIIQQNYEKLKDSPEVTVDLLTPMSKFGVYSEDGQFLYGNFPSESREEIWEHYRKGARSIGVSNFITSIERETEILIINYPLTMQYKNETLRNILPNAEIIFACLFLLQFIIVIVVWSNRFAKRVNREIKALLIVTEQIQEQNLDFDAGKSNIKEIDMVLNGIDEMKQSLKIALEKQWLSEKLKIEQISALAHDIKTPLTIVRGNVELLNETELTDEQKIYSQYIKESSKQIDRYVQQLLSYTKKEMEQNQISEKILVRKWLNSLQNQSTALAKTKNVGIVWKIDVAEKLYIKGNEHELERAMMNILTNGVDFSPAGSTVSVNVFTEQNQLTLQVIDQGKGFSKKMLKYGKEPFFMDNESRTKTGHHGLGLYIANTIITKYKGELTLANGEGGLVTVKLPVFQEEE